MEAKVKTADEDGGVAPPPFFPNHSHRSSSSYKPSWLLLTIAEMDERVKGLAINVQESASNSFAVRAEAYYQQRPQLLSLLQDLYNGYISLADRYCQSLAKNNNHHRRRFSSPISPLYFGELEQFDGEDNADVNDSDDAESSLSYQPPPSHALSQIKLDADMIIADLVIKNVDYDFVVHELSIVESRWEESSRKIELQKSLLEVLESERMILLSENATVRYQFNALVEENKELASESLFMKRKAADLARCVLKMREDHRVFMVSRKIEDLQGQIYELEKRNKEYYDQLVNRDEGKICKKAKSKGYSSKSVSVLKHKGGKGGDGKRAVKLWDRVKNLDLFLCGPHVKSTCC